MIAYINGLLIDKNEKSLVVLAQSIGYQIFAPTEVIAQAQLDQKIQLYLHTVVREDELSLYGFLQKEEKQFFEQLISVSGIGPKMAIEILSSPIHLTKQAIVNEDVALLTKIKGLGKKTAERLILELKNKVDALITSSGSGGQTSYDQDAAEALINLGYEKIQVMKVLSQLPSEIKGTEATIKYFLQHALQ